jgi:hypothetical protein
MATILETYCNIKENMDSKMKSAKPGSAQIWLYQELLYRIEVLQVCQLFQRSAPESADPKALAPHYQMLNAYIENLTLERRFGANNGEDAQKVRDTALGNLRRVVEDYRKRLGSFAPGNDAGRYIKEVASVIQTVLPAWIQYRQACIEIKKEAA